MSTSRHFDKICLAVISVTLVITVLFMNGAALGIKSAVKVMGYESRLFDNSRVHSVDIVADDWDSFIDKCENEEYIACTVIIDGEKYGNTAIRAKGNTSLSSVKNMGSSRYSFKLEFDHFTNGRTYHGLDKLCFNNLIQDNTMMKDYIVYTLMNDFGVDSPLCSFSFITVNGSDWGLYLAVEGIEDSFLQRNYGSSKINLYKPDSIGNGGGRGNGKNFEFDRDFTEISDDDNLTVNETPDDFEEKPGLGNEAGNSFEPKGERPEMPEGFGNADTFGKGEVPPDKPDFKPDGNRSIPPDGFNPDENFQAPPDGFSPYYENEENKTESPSAQGEKDEQSGKSRGGPGGNQSDDIKLKYIDDDPDSYKNIFDNAKTNIKNEDKSRLIESLKKLSEYKELDSILDMDEVLRYFVVHNFVCNGDSYTGSMIHNYYLGEKNGKLSMIPWDYNLAFGTFMGNNASGTVNTSIDQPISNSSNDDRPMCGWIFSDEKYTEEYHRIFSEFIDKWFSDGKLESLILSTAEMIKPYVEKDPSKFCTYDEFEKGVSALSTFISLRGKSISLQLDGDTTPVDTSRLNLSDMGSMGGNMKGKKPGSNPAETQ